MSDDTPDVRLGKGTRARVRNDSQVYSKIFSAVMRFARQSSKKISAGTTSTSKAGNTFTKSASIRAQPKHLQRCAVRVTYDTGQVAGQWAAHGKYIERDSANELAAAPTSPVLNAEVNIDISRSLVVRPLTMDTNLSALELEQRSAVPHISSVPTYSAPIIGLLNTQRRISDLPTLNIQPLERFNDYSRPPIERTNSRYSTALRGLTPLRKSDFVSPQQRRPAGYQNDLHKLSGIPVAQFGQSNKKLLSGDARDNVGSQRTTKLGTLRRQSDGGAGTPQANSRRNAGYPSGARPIKQHHAFGSAGVGIDAQTLMHEWQTAGDEHLFKIIVSPEFGDRLNHEQHARALIKRMELDLNTSLQWVATTHHNTEHTHTHIALRGVDEYGNTLRVPRQYIQNKIREHAGALATEQLGYRTEHDAVLAAMREVPVHRFTSLDADLKKLASASPVANHVAIDLSKAKLLVLPQITQRLYALETMGLSQRNATGQWLMRSDAAQVLRTMQAVADRQRALQAHHKIVSDHRMPMRVTDVNKLRTLEGRVLGHGLDDATGKPFMLLEGLDANVHYIIHNSAIMDARQKQQLKPGSFITLQKTFDSTAGKKLPRLIISDLGDATKLLSNASYIRKTATQRLSKPPTQTVYGGWFGQHEKLVTTYLNTHRDSIIRSTTKPHTGRGL